MPDLPLALRSLEVVNYFAMRAHTPLFIPVSFRLTAGQSLHLQAGNGGGKTTMLRCLSGMAIDYRGEILANDTVTTPALLRQESGYMNDRAGIFGNLTTMENLRYMLALNAIMPSADDCIAALTRFDLQEVQHLPASALSKGQKKRLHLAWLSLDQKTLWLLDEPFDGLDSQGKTALQTLITRHTNCGGMVIFSSHIDSPASFGSKSILQLMPVATD